MKRLAAHYVLLPDDRLLKQHYVETDDKNHLLGVFPLNREIADTVFFNGILMLRRCASRNEATEVEIYFLDRIDLLPTNFGADDCRRHGYIQRLG
ncbi:MAG: hypothetical protein LBH19_08175 [Dysgonamonadaceae bacterium]|jgi:hypothetical protein|nr:hypothetical protein [Dysgonamonadaceae bacterium]